MSKQYKTIPPKVERGYIVARFMFGTFTTIGTLDRLYLTNLYNNVYRTLLVMKSINPIKDAELTKKAMELWKAQQETTEYKISGDALYVFLEYLSSMFSEKDHKDYLGIKPYLTEKDIPREDKLELLKIIFFFNDYFKEHYGIDLPTEQVRKAKSKKEKPKRGKKKKVVKQKPKKNVKKFIEKKEKKLKLKEVVRLAKERASISMIDKQNDLEKSEDET